MICYTYNRVSDDDQQTDGTSLESQTARNEAHANALGFALVRSFVEVHTGAELWERPVLNQIRDDIRARKVSALVCFAIDRLTRDVAHLMILQDECERHGCALHFTTETLDSTPEGKLLASVRGYVAEVERLKIIERTVRGRKHRLQSGKINSDCYDLYGYQRDKEKGVRLVVDDEATIVRSIFDAVCAGDALSAIAKRLNHSDTPSPFAAKGVRPGSSWTIATIRLMIRNEAYKGDTFGWRYTTGKNKNARVMRPRDEWIKLPEGVTPPIVTPEQWQRANDALAANVGDKTRNTKKQFLLRGLVYCAKCGEKSYPCLNHKKYVYTCGRKVRSYHGKRVERCDSSTTPVAALDADVWQRVARVMASPRAALAEFLSDTEPAKPSPTANEIRTTRKTIDRLEQAQRRLLKRLRDAGDDLAPLILSELRDTQTELTKAQDALAVLEQRQSQIKHEQNHAAEMFAAMEAAIKSAGESSDSFAYRRAVIELFQVKVFASGREWKIEIVAPSGRGSNHNGVPVYI